MGELVDAAERRAVEQGTAVELGRAIELGRAVELGRTLRALRRRADLSQRELAERSGVPQATLARIESGRTRDPRFRTVERLVRAARGDLAIGVPAGEVLPAPEVPHDEMRDEAGRRYPAHLDVWEVREPRDWPGAWWADWYKLPPERYPLPLPPATYERNRRYRDNRRRREAVRRTVRLRRVTGADVPHTGWRFVAELPDGELVGELRAHERDPHLRYGQGLAHEREMALDGILVAYDYRRLGIGRQLVEALVGGMRDREIVSAYAIADGRGIDLLLACGFRFEASRPAALRLDRPRR
ncbi:GNAT family N-acetyltransferase [Micromonospora sp. WP24]|uniref:GNAT family N-acetyltransferase n=1 Tax=Micromonospora sp. WP24 TaxID=2604469 RepID=UPI002107C101|nr:GNAT family N-acetyltransferase [Micromonospora sp. WP24]